MTEEVIFTIILHAGNARAEAYDALRAAQAGDFDKAAEHLRQAEAEVGAAHRAQADMIQQEAQGNKVDVTLLIVHAQDHLMTALSEKNLIENMVEMHKTIKQLAAKLEATQCQG
ncbi:MAG: phosphotransferase system lactose/cellobiose-specific subunit [Sporomusa sp.]|jgi:PTS system cellobiose-specific IIA component|nr:phosphotransferase system lactose/cellobiose-specific subunit [Sporomusa sp.]